MKEKMQLTINLTDKELIELILKYKPEALTVDWKNPEREPLPTGNDLGIILREIPSCYIGKVTNIIRLRSKMNNEWVFSRVRKVHVREGAQYFPIYRGKVAQTLRLLRQLGCVVQNSTG